MAPRPINVLSLCSGIGGIELGLKLATGGAARTVCYVEREGYPAAVLAARMEEGHLDPAPIWSDLRTFDAGAWRGVVDCVTGGYPCQPFSLAGKRRGEDDPRHLWPSVLRVLVESGAAVGFFENVRGHVSKGLSQVLQDLAGVGFDAEWDVFSAEEEGAPHRRERLFLLAHCDSPKHPIRVPRGIETEGSQPCRNGSVQLLARQRTLWGAEPADGGVHVADADGEGPPQQGRVERTEWGRAGNGGSPPRDWWAAEPGMGRVADGVPDRVDRLRALGNGVVPVVAARAFTELAQRAGVLR